MTLPTMPSGVTTAMPFSMPLVEPRSMNTARAVDTVLFPVTREATVLDGVRIWNAAKARARSAVDSSLR